MIPPRLKLLGALLTVRACLDIIFKGCNQSLFIELEGGKVGVGIDCVSLIRLLKWGLYGEGVGPGRTKGEVQGAQ